MKTRCTTRSAYQLLHDGALALAEIEKNGVRVDKAYLERAIKDMDAQIAGLEAKLKAGKIWKVWQKVYGHKANVGSRPQLAEVVFKHMGHKAEGQTRTGRDRTDKAALEKLDLPFVKTFVRAEELKKAKTTYLLGILRELVRHDDGDYYVHPSYNLHLVRSLRSSCDNPNWQNVPNRNPVIAEIIRRCYIPRRGCDLVEIDYGQIEVRINAVYSQDPVLKAYCADESKDMHRDMAAKMFFLKPADVTKPVRHVAKNRVVFPYFYGSAWFQTAPSVWEAVHDSSLKLALPDGTPLKEHLRRKGITKLGELDPRGDPGRGTFAAHLKEIGAWFWGPSMFGAHAAWKRRFYEDYQRKGGFPLLTGFWVEGDYARNDVTNYPVQGAAFHCELWSLIQIIKRIRKYKMGAKVVGEIHDSDDADVPHRERDDYVNMCLDIKTRELTEAWPWINVPITTEVEVSPEGTSWFDKKVWVESNGHWGPKT